MSLAPHQLEQPRSDGATPDAARGSAAFGALYKEHFDGLYDFVARIVRDSDLAGEIVQAAFTKAWDELRNGRELEHPKAWLYTVARNQALDELRRRQRLTDEPLLYALPDPSRLSDPQAVAEDNEIVELVWDSAAALNPDEYSLLDLHVRHGFGAADLADALELERGAVYTRLSRLRTSLEESVSLTLLVRRGSEDCPELAAIICEHDGGGAISRQLRRAVRAHVKECAVCTEARRRLVSPVALFGALVPIVPLAGVREGILAAILPGGGHAAGAAVAGGAGAVAAVRHSSKVKYAVGATGVAAAAAVVAVALSSGPSVSDPSRASSLDHAVGVASADPTVAMSWLPGKNAKGYSVVFSRERSTEPPARENVTGTQYTSPPLGPGRWWFILRSHGRDGSWTDTLRVGPFVITAEVARKAQHTAKKPAARAKHRRAQHRRHAASPASKPAATPAQIVAAVRAAPKAVAPAPKPAPRNAPVKKKPPKKKSPPPATSPPPAATTPPATAVPPVQPQAQPQTPAAETPPVIVTPPPPAHGGDDDQGEGDGGHEGGDPSGGDHGGDHGGGHGH